MLPNHDKPESGGTKTPKDSDPSADAADYAQEVEAVIRWAESLRPRLGTLEDLVERAAARPGLDPAVAQAAEQMRKAIGGITRGEMPMEMWKLQLTLSNGGEDSHGTRIYVLSADDEGIRAERYGSEWQRGVGSDSWSGPEFHFIRESRWHQTGDWGSFVSEVEEALSDLNYELSIYLNDESVGDHEGELE